MADWIPLTDGPQDEPPWDGEPVLIATNHRYGGRVYQARWTDAIHGEGIFGWAVDDRKFGPYALRGYTLVTHWMSLPEPPNNEARPAGAIATGLTPGQSESESGD